VTPRILHRHRPDEALIPVARHTPAPTAPERPRGVAPAPRPAPAAHLSGSHKDRPVDFDDMDVFDGMPTNWRPGRPHHELGYGFGSLAMACVHEQDRAPRDAHRYAPYRLVPATLLHPIPVADVPAYSAPAIPTRPAVRPALQLADISAALDSILAGLTAELEQAGGAR
jgi:hypothetical protein